MFETGDIVQVEIRGSVREVRVLCRVSAERDKYFCALSGAVISIRSGDVVSVLACGWNRAKMSVREEAWWHEQARVDTEALDES